LTTSSRVPSIADILTRAREDGSKLDIEMAAQTPLIAEEAYDIQSIMARRFGPVGAFKVARKPGQPAIMAPIYAKDIHSSPASIHYDNETRIGIELEVGFRILANLPAPDESGYLKKLRARVALVPAIEIVTTRIANLDLASPMLRLADNQLNGGLIVGEEVHDWQEMLLTSVNGWLTTGTHQLTDGPVSVPGGDAFENFRTLVEMVGIHCGGLQPGHVVITGSLNGLPYLHETMSVNGGIEGIGRVSVNTSL
jgi:2-keto-4-pentenoate hydratase